MRALVAALVLLVAGCSQPAEPAPEVVPGLAAPAPTYDLVVRVSEERPDGAPLAAVVQVGRLGDDDQLAEAPLLRSTDADGRVRLGWSQPVRLVLQAVAIDAKAWTVEGGRIDVGETVVALDGHLVSERDLFLPLYRTSLAVQASASLSTSLADPGLAGMPDPVHTEAGLPFPEGLQATYLERLSGAQVTLAWQDTATSRADLAAGLAWDGVVWVTGEAAGPGLVPAPRTATYSGLLPPEGRPTDLAGATLQATAVSRTAVVGDVPLSFDVELSFGDRRPAQLPDPRCDHRANTKVQAVCLLPWG